MRVVAAFIVLSAVAAPLAQRRAAVPPPPSAQVTEARWIDATIKAMTLDDKVGQLVFSTIDAAYLPTDSDRYDDLAKRLKQRRLGGLVIASGASAIGSPASLASTLNRLQALSNVPLLVAADFQNGAGATIAGATPMPAALAFAAIGGEDADEVVREAARVTAVEARAMGVHVLAAPRTFGESAQRGAELSDVYQQGLRAGGALAALRNLSSVAGVAPAGPVAGTTDAAIVASAAEASAFRAGFKFDGLVLAEPPAGARWEAAACVPLLAAGADVIVDPIDEAGTIAAIKSAVNAGTIAPAALDASVRRILRAKSRAGLAKTAQMPIDDVPKKVGGRLHDLAAAKAAKRAVTLLKDDRNQVPLRIAADASVLYLEAGDAASAASGAGRAFAAELRARWPRLDAIDLSERSTSANLDAARRDAGKHDAIVAAIVARGDVAPPIARLFADIARDTAGSPKPFVTAVVGDPRLVAPISTVPAIVVMYGTTDFAELALARAVAGETPIAGHLPVAIPGLFELGYGIVK